MSDASNVLNDFSNVRLNTPCGDKPNQALITQVDAKIDSLLAQAKLKADQAAATQRKEQHKTSRAGALILAGFGVVIAAIGAALFFTGVASVVGVAYMAIGVSASMIGAAKFAYHDTHVMFPTLISKPVAADKSKTTRRALKRLGPRVKQPINKEKKQVGDNTVKDTLENKTTEPVNQPAHSNPFRLK